MLAQVNTEEPGTVGGFREEANLRLEVSFFRLLLLVYVNEEL
jgi:hypothetical protein